MNYLIGTIEAAYNRPFDNENDELEVRAIINSEFKRRLAANLDYVEIAKIKILEYFTKNFFILTSQANRDLNTEDFISVVYLEVELIGEETFGDNPLPKYSGSLKYYAKSEQIRIINVFSDERIAYYSYQHPTLRFMQLSDKVEFIVDDKELDEPEE